MSHDTYVRLPSEGVEAMQAEIRFWRRGYQLLFDEMRRRDEEVTAFRLQGREDRTPNAEDCDFLRRIGVIW
jgi:hypothetical protein